MERLTGLDAGFLYMETPTLHMHTLKIGIIDPAEAPGGYSFDRFKAVLAERLHLLPPFRRRLVWVPMQLHHPLWVEDRDFDLDYHVRRVGIPQPGTQAEMDELIGDIGSRPLDRARPLWQIWVLEGLEGGRVAFAAKIHHAAADGVAAGALLANVMSLTRDAPPPPVPAEPWRGERVPTGLELLIDAFADLLKTFLRLPQLLGTTGRGVKDVLRHRQGTDSPPPRPIVDVPKASFNTALTPHRVFASTSLPLGRVRALKDAAGVKLNDVVLAIVSGSLRHYLGERGELLDRSLVAGIPVGTDAPDAGPRLIGNRVSNMFTSLATDRDDPTDRLEAIHRITMEAKQVQQTLGLELMQDWVEFTPPRALTLFMRAYSRARMARHHRPPINLVVSNVPGPRDPLYIAGAELTDLFSVGPILEGVGLNVTVWSYTDRLNFSAIACRESLPELRRVTDGFEGALAELEEAYGLSAARDPA